jgi:hypothetical protein
MCRKTLPKSIRPCRKAARPGRNFFPERFFVSQLQRPDEAFSAMAPFRVQLSIGLSPKLDSPFAILQRRTVALRLFQTGPAELFLKALPG